MGAVGVVPAWLISLAFAAAGVVILVLYPPASGAASGLEAGGWGVGAAALVFALFVNPLLLSWLPGLRDFWPRALMGLLLSGGLAYYVLSQAGVV